MNHRLCIFVLLLQQQTTIVDGLFLGFLGGIFNMLFCGIPLLNHILCDTAAGNTTMCDISDTVVCTSDTCKNGGRCRKSPSALAPFGCDCIAPWGGGTCESYTFEPPDGKTLVMIGQSMWALDEYYENVVQDNPELMPGGTTLYINLYDSRDNWKSLQAFSNDMRYSNMTLLLSVSIKTNYTELGDGEYDDAIVQLGNAIRNLDRPVYLRIGGEFDNPTGGNPNSEDFKHAWRRIVDILRRENVTNFATVFASMFQVPIGISFEDNYAGDEYVDWVGFSFWGGFATDLDGGMLEFARCHGKPAMIAESAPMLGRTNIEFLGSAMWWLFFRRYFDIIQQNSDVIKAFHYINDQWGRKNDLWLSEVIYWPFVNMETRVHVNPYILERWKDELRGSQYLHSNNGLFEILGYSPYDDSLKIAET